MKKTDLKSKILLKQKKMKCEIKNCKYSAYWGENEKLISCINHKKENYINYFDQKCAECNAYVFYGLEIPTHCAIHKDEKHKKFGNRICRKCTKEAKFGDPGNLLALFCKEHSDDKIHIDVKHTYCKVCKVTRASFGDPSDRKPIVCAKKSCREEHYVNVVSKKCQEKLCNKDATWGKADSKGCTHCMEHGKLKGLVDKKNNTCIMCKKSQKSHGEKGGRAQYCSKCAKGPLVNLIAKEKCEFCDIKPTFGLIEEGKIRVCAEHRDKLPNCIDLKHLQCNYENCQRRAELGFVNSKITRCDKHPLVGQLKTPKKLCECGHQATFGSQKKPVHCEKCKKDNEFSVIYQACTHCGCIDILLNSLCENCKPVEKGCDEVKKYLDLNNQIYTRLNKLDEEITEFIFECDTHKIALEVFKKQKEHERILNDEKIIYISYNNGPYILNKESKNIVQGAKRLSNLMSTLKYWQKTEPKYLHSIVYMYFDEDDSRRWRREINL